MWAPRKERMMARVESSSPPGMSSWPAESMVAELFGATAAVDEVDAGVASIMPIKDAAGDDGCSGR